MIVAQGQLERLAQSSECFFGGMTANRTHKGTGTRIGTCEKLSLDPSRALFFMCASTEVDGQQLYCGDWVTNPDGECSGDYRNYESCTVANGPVRISEEECSGHAFLQKFVRGSTDRPYCDPLVRGGSCVPAMFFAFTDDDDASLWPVCVRTWAKETCGVNFDIAIEGFNVVALHTVQVTLTFEQATRRLQQEPLCTNHAARALSAKLSTALRNTSREAAESANPIVVSDSDCMSESASGSPPQRVVVAELLVRGGGSQAKAAYVAQVARSADFSSNLRAEGVSAVVAVSQGDSAGAAPAQSDDDARSSSGTHRPKVLIALLSPWALIMPRLNSS